MNDFRQRQAPLERQRRAAEEAASWYLDQREGMDDAGQARFMAWLRASPLHVQEYLVMTRLHGDLAAAAALDPLDASQLAEQAARDRVVVPLRLAPPAVAVAPERGRLRMPGWMTQAAAVLLVAALGAAAWLKPAPTPWTAYATASDVRGVALADGTQLQLDRDTVLAVRMEPRQRMIDVLRGGALFDVGHDPSRPLRVRLGANLLQDIGTVFDAHHTHDGGNVTVISGRVKVAQRGAGWLDGGDIREGAEVADLRAGQQASLRGDGSLDLVDDHADIAGSTAWLPADIHFEHATVADVARRFNAYSSRPLRIDDASLAATRISGRFHARDVEAFIAYLHTLPGVRVERGADGIRIVKASKAGRL